jgi:hypothetical protein
VREDFVEAARLVRRAAIRGQRFPKEDPVSDERAKTTVGASDESDVEAHKSTVGKTTVGKTTIGESDESDESDENDVEAHKTTVGKTTVGKTTIG